MTFLQDIFSTDLIQIPNAVATTAVTGILSVQKAMWVYVLASAVLTAVTVALAFLWDRRALWKIRSKNHSA